MSAYPIIANCNYESADDTTIHEIRKALDSDLTDNADLIAAMDALEETLSQYAEDDGQIAVTACRDAETAVLAAWTPEVADEVRANRIANYRD